ncbi:MAG: SDR family oxidoreductase [Solirubrobacterales bacterium]|nr:MAG: SDR family oxidoreductase [Solirubrobacterales bacterium]
MENESDEQPQRPRRALVTGAARGIGAAIAVRLRGAGLEVLTLDREAGCDFTVDLRTGQLPDLSGIDVCVSNAAITDTIAAADRIEPEAWARDIDVNLTGAFRVVPAGLGGMRERRWGRIVVISSGAARDGLPGQVAYTASKAGLLGMVKTIAAENVRRGITANAVLPGMVSTEKVREMPPEILEALDDLLPMQRMARPEEVAALATFLCSEIAGYITGEAIGIDGGASLNTMSLTRALRDRGGWG